MTTAKTLLGKIKTYCLHCCGGSKTQVENCSGCLLTPYRMGFEQDPKKKISTGKLLRVIKVRCLECATTRADVVNCTSGPNASPEYHVCELWPYRLGIDPKPAVRSELQIAHSKAIGEKFKGNLNSTEEVPAL